MTNSIPVRIADGDGDLRSCEIEISNHAPWWIGFAAGTFSGRRYEGRDLFDALCNLRDDIERYGFKILCAGARVDVFPSGMTRETTGGRKACVMEIGLPATQLVDIFDDASSELVGSTTAQREYREKWIRALNL